MFDSFEWSFVVVLAPIALAVAIGYALLSRRKMSRSEQDVRDRETRKQYRDETDGQV